MSDNEDGNDDLFVHDDSYDPDKAGLHFDDGQVALPPIKLANKELGSLHQFENP